MIEIAVGRRPPFGSSLQKKLRSVSRIKLRLCPKGTDGTISIDCVPGSPELVNGSESQLGTGFVHCLAYGAPGGQLLLHRRFPVRNPPGLVLNLQKSSGLVAHLIYEDLIGFDDFQIIGDVRMDRMALGPSVASPRAVPAPGKAKRQKVEKLSGHEATIALVRARQGKGQPWVNPISQDQFIGENRWTLSLITKWGDDGRTLGMLAING